MEDFFTLKEIMSLDTKMAQHRQVIHEEQKRLERLESMRQTREREYVRAEEQDKVLSNELQAAEKSLTQAQQRIAFLVSQEKQITTGPALLAWEHECQDVRKKITDKETTTLNLMLELEKIEATKLDAEKFLQGLKQSYLEIKNEVESVEKVETESINKLQSRKEILINSLPQILQRSYLKAHAKHPKDLAFTWESARTCSQCYYQLSSIDSQKIESGELIDNCKGCGRIFLPLKVVKNQA